MQSWPMETMSLANSVKHLGKAAYTALPVYIKITIINLTTAHLMLAVPNACGAFPFPFEKGNKRARKQERKEHRPGVEATSCENIDTENWSVKVSKLTKNMIKFNFLCSLISKSKDCHCLLKCSEVLIRICWNQSWKIGRWIIRIRRPPPSTCR